MKLQNLTKAIALIAAAGISSASFAANDLATKTGDALTGTADNVFQKLTGKSVYQEVNHPVSLYDYDQATSAYEDAWISGRFNAANGNQERASYDVNLDTKYERVFSSPDSNTKVQADANANIKRSSTKGEKNKETWGATASVNYDQYFTPGSNGAFWYGKGDVSVTERIGKNYGGLSNPASNVTAGLGYGRVVNVTPMARAIRIVESLVERGVLKSTPSKAVYNKIAQIASQQDEYRSKYGMADYAQMWVRDIERALGQSLGANGAIKAYEVLVNEKILTRKYGWDVRAGLGANLSTYSGVNKKIRPALEAEANYFYPIGLRTQFSNEAKYNTVLDKNNTVSTLSNNMGLTYEVSDRVDWVNAWDMTHTINSKANNTTKHTVSTSFLYDINNALTYDAKLSFDHDTAKVNAKKVDTKFTTGITYRLK